MKIQDFITKLKEQPQDVAFADTMATIEANYTFTATTFKNGDTTNEAGQNSGSCKLFAFAKIQELSTQDTLACFGEYYRNDVLENPNGTDHQNIRNFVAHSWSEISFEGKALVRITQD